MIDLYADDEVRYPGSKAQAGVHEWICSRLADHVFYAEPFVGKGGIFRNKVPALRTILVDRDPEIVDWWKRRLAGHTAEPGGGRGHRQKRRERSQHVEVLQGCGIEWTERAISWAPRDLLVYLDPPYLPVTRVRQKLYRFEMSVDDHQRLLTAARQLPCPVAISGYPSQLYAEYLADWDLATREVVTRGGTLRTECLWTNAPARNASAVAMHYSELGDDYRERERVAKKLRRWEGKFCALSPAERRAILLGLLNAERSISRDGFR